MRYALVLSFVAALLGGCASHKPEDFNGIWINQNAINAAAKGGNLRQALQSNGPNLEWRINTAANQALVTSGFELSEAKLQAADKGWNAVFYPNYSIGLTLDGDELVQAASENDPEQRFHKADKPLLDAPPRTTFELALYEAYLKGDWAIVEGPGQGATMQFRPNGSLEGMPNLDRYALCLDGDCATMTGEYDSLWLEKNQQGNPWIFKRDGKTLEIFQAINQARDDEMPELRPGARRWLLQRK
ncbi:lipoprotein [Pseudomonas laurentiana]|uniref:hypothetical protein n=1 Tax=Pseudomonas laurentiana TaxID=2364649 RepID=UPI0016736D36|nr:hypothetical protein [Pseudomonas laurentiana]GGU49124.1 lipoprotein [Pseudomonas laurentiana]